MMNVHDSSLARPGHSPSGAPRTVASVLSGDHEGAADRAAWALTLFNDSSIPTDELAGFVAERLALDRPDKETFVPLFMTNHCHSGCKMCGMRRGNAKLSRKFSTKSMIEDQLRILHDAEGVRAVGFLTGEYDDPFTRQANAFMVGWAIHRAFELGFERAYFNIGSMGDDEIHVLGDWLGPYRQRPVTMCVFQETYDPQAYERFMGDGRSGFPKADYHRRLQSYDNWLKAGFRHVNPGFLVGLHDIADDMRALILHVHHLLEQGADVSISLPRLRPALGASNRSLVSDDTYLRVIAIVALVFPTCRIVLTTREDQAFQDLAVRLVGTISPGSPDVSPYRWNAAAANAEESSQFLIPDLRRPREILGRLVENGFAITYFEPRVGPAAAESSAA